MYVIRQGCLKFRTRANSVLEVIVAGVPFAVCNVAGKISGLGGVWPHRGGPLGQGAISGPRLVCPWHAWEWSCSTGENDMHPSKKVAAYDLKIEDGEIYLNLRA